MLLPVLVAAALLVPPADSFSGTWQITGDIMGNPLNEVCTITQTGTALTGSCKAAAPAEAPAWAVTGEVRGDTVLFSHGGEYDGAPLTLAYSGRLATPAQLKGSVMVEPFGAGGTFAAIPMAAVAAPPVPAAKP
jgi:hypothetical protein